MLVSAPDVVSVAPLAIDIVPPVALVRPLLTVSVPAVTFSAPELLVPPLPPFSVLVPLLVIVPDALLMPPVPVSLSVPPASVMVPVLLTAVLPVSVSVPSMVMPPEVLELLVSAPDVVSVAPLEIDIVPAAGVGQAIAHRQRAGGHVQRAGVAGAAAAAAQRARTAAGERAPLHC